MNIYRWDALRSWGIAKWLKKPNKFGELDTACDVVPHSVNGLIFFQILPP